ncbi:archaetidylserine decarboxylase [Tepidimonas sp.]|uniref:archaetidylserine decarboxylase n=1 Tax=Tepidimonas sp. TaxID=2002775 RepID=UPI002FE3F1F8
MKPEPTPAGWRAWRDRVLQHETLNYALTNHVPRVALTLLIGRLSRIDSPAFTRLAVAVWRWFADLDLSEAAAAEYRSLRDVFTRALRAGARPFDPDPQVLCSPCDAIVGACGDVHGTTVWQAKGMPYRLEDLIGPEAAAVHANGRFITLRLTSTMYHRFHAPADLRVRRVRYVSGDVFNVNPPALRRIPALFCRNERALIEATLPDGSPIALVPVAAILVASIRLHFLDVTLHLRWRGPHELPCDVRLSRGQEMGWFEHGSTIILFVPAHWRLADGVESGRTIRAGQALWQRED